MKLAIVELILFYILTFYRCVAFKSYYVSVLGGCADDNINCNNITSYFKDPEAYVRDNVVFYFMEGTHLLELEELIVISEVNNFTLMGLGSHKQGYHETVMESTVQIHCQYNDAGIAILNSTSVRIIGITFVGCGGYLTTEIVDDTRWTIYAMALVLIDTKDIVLDQVSIQNSTNFGLVAINALNITINNSSFAGNNLNNYPNCTIGGNAQLVYTVTKKCDDQFTVHSTLIQNSNFSFGANIDHNYSRSYISGSGLSIYMEQIDNYGVNVQLESLVLFGNTGVTCGNLCYQVVMAMWYSLNISNTISVYANEINRLPANVKPNFVYGGGLHVYIGRQQQTNFMDSVPLCYNTNSITNIPEIPLSITNSQFSHNHATYGGGMAIFWRRNSRTRRVQTMSIDSCQMKNNSGFAGASFFYTQSNRLNYRILIINSSLVESRHFHPFDIGPENVESAVLIRRTLNLTLVNVNISNNPITGMLLLNAGVCFSGYNNVFSNNEALNGGAISILGDSMLYFLPPVHILFNSNSASNRGGAMYINTVPFTQQPCFFSPYDPLLTSDPDINVTFIGNKAKVAGSAIYGGTIDNCYISVPSRFATSGRVAILGIQAFHYIFNLEKQEGQSVISSEPEKFCFCVDNKPNCSVSSLSFSTFPGQPTNISIVTVGQKDGISPGVVVIEEWNTLETGSVRKTLISTDSKCTTNLYTPNVNASTSFPSIQSIDFFLPNAEELVEKHRVKFHIKQCPLGFQLSPNTKKCDCADDVLDIPNINCSVMTQSFHHSGDMWLGYVNTSSCIIAYPECYFDYCRKSHVNFTLEQPDVQCALNRSGILCGQCAEGLSLMLGTNQCGECTNDYLALIIPFALAGIALVVFLIALNLTVSVGTINGLIFYANIVKINGNKFFDDKPSVFIAWFNLDFGIESCFYNGMTTLSKTWLQLIFPLYIWVLMIIIIKLSHHYSRVSKLMGRHSVSVLATLLLLSFTKIITTCISAWQISYINCGSHNYTVWTPDPSMKYWESRHLVMFLVTLSVSLFVVAPYIFLLLFSPMIEKYFSRYICCKYWVKLKPFFDAYNGPYKDSHRYWTGLLLLVRFILAQVYAYNNNPTTTSVAVISCGAILLSLMTFFKGVYRNNVNNFLECWFLLNVMFITMARLDNTIRGGIPLSILVAMVTFFIIVTCHLFTYTYLKKVPPRVKKFYYQNIRKKQMESNIGVALSQVDLLDDTRVISHSDVNSSSVSFELQERNLMYREGSVFVRMKRETLLREPNDDYVLVN